ncbi:MAG: ribonuclease J [Desulfuromonadaceae bacterium]|nr:ribonuclease J [Desulfuromonadaceae bacterium]
MYTHSQSDISKRDDLIRILPLGGAGEIGMNLLVIEYNDSILIVDCGLKFCGVDAWGVDFTVPDITWLQQQHSRICGIVITHGHEDHIGALPFVLDDLGNPPIFATPFTLELIRTRLDERGFSGACRLQAIHPCQLFTCGSFQIEPFSAAHSIPAGVGLAITTAAGCIIHSGDFKLDSAPIDGVPTDIATLARYANTGVLALLADSTNAAQPGFSGSEHSLRPMFERIMHTCRAAVYLSTFSSSIHRLQLAIEVAQQAGRKIVLLGRGLINNVNTARRTGHLRVSSDIIVDLHEAEHLDRNRLCIIASGCQGEPGSALLRIAMGTHPNFDICPDDAVIISARTIPGNEVQLNNLMNQLGHLGAQIYSGADAHVHVSGHACAEELRQIISLVRPRFFIPLHGETRHLVQHAKLAQECGIKAENTLILQNGTGAILSYNGVKREQSIPCNPKAIEMHTLTSISPAQLQERKRMGTGGCVLVSLCVNSKLNQLGAEPIIHFFGINNDTVHSLLSAEINTRIKEILAQIQIEVMAGTPPLPTENKHIALETAIQDASARVCKQTLGYRPQIVPTILYH